MQLLRAFLGFLKNEEVVFFKAGDEAAHGVGDGDGDQGEVDVDANILVGAGMQSGRAGLRLLPGSGGGGAETGGGATWTVLSGLSVCARAAGRQSK